MAKLDLNAIKELCEPEDVQLDVEQIAFEIQQAIGADTEAIKPITAILRRRVSGKGAHKCGCGEEDNFECRVCGVAWPEVSNGQA